MSTFNRLLICDMCSFFTLLGYAAGPDGEGGGTHGTVVRQVGSGWCALQEDGIVRGRLSVIRDSTIRVLLLHHQKILNLVGCCTARC